MKWSSAILPSRRRFQEIELTLLLGWALLFPDKFSRWYFLGFAGLLAVFILNRLRSLESVALSRFSGFLLLFNAVFIFGAFFSRHPLASILFAADILLVSLWFSLQHFEAEDVGRTLRRAAHVISVSSLAMLVLYALQGGRLPVAALFRNPILQGVASALAALVFLHGLLRRYRHADLLLLALNAGAVVVSASKAAALGLAAFAAVMIFRGRRRWLVYLSALLLLLVLAPNPLRRMVGHSLRRDPYVLNRLDIWRMSARMFRGHPWTGVGPGLFAEAARRFNFPQENGPARYFKVPESAHSDFWQIIAENGLPGLAFVLLFLFFAIRRLSPLPGDGLTGWLLAFLLAQMLLFNIVFHYFFLVLFLFLAGDLFSSGRRFIVPRPAARAFLACLAAFLAIVLYLLPFLAGRSLDRAAGERDPVRRFALLQRAARLSPLDERAPMARAALLRAFARARSDRAAWADALEDARLAQRLHRGGTEPLLLESELFRDVQEQGWGYPGLCDETLAPLRRAAGMDPFNPFLKMRQAVILRQYGRTSEARAQARAALALEPDYAAAIVFLHELDGAAGDGSEMRRRLALIREKAARLRPRPGTYLFGLFQVPSAPPET